MNPERTIATTFPLAGALQRPEFGFVEKKLKAREIEGFGASHIANLKQDPPDFLIVYATAWDPLHMLDVPWIRRFLHDYYGYEPPLWPGEIGEILSMHPAQRWKRGGLTMELLARGEAPKIYVRYTPVDLHDDLWSGRIHNYQILLPRVYLDWITERTAKAFE
jgi:hypothetical protein